MDKFKNKPASGDSKDIVPKNRLKVNKKRGVSFGQDIEEELQKRDCDLHSIERIPHPIDDQKQEFVINFGLLKSKRVYRMEVLLPLEPFTIFQSIDPSCKVEIDRIKSLLHIDLCASRQGFFSARFVLRPENANNDKSDISVTLKATIMGKGSGTPLYKECIKCISKDSDADSDGETEWQGFPPLEEDEIEN